MKLYELEWDKSRLIDDEMDYDIHFDGENRGDVYKALSSDRPTINIPKLIFIANYNEIPKQQFPIANIPYVPFVHQNMYQILCDLGSFEHETIPIVLCDDTIFTPYYDENGRFQEELLNVNKDYLAIRLVTRFNDINYDLTEVKKVEMYGEEYTTYPGDIVLNMPQNGLPPIFQIEHIFDTFFVPESTKKALEEAGVLGCLFKESKVYVK